jgi:2-amino-4-hydroxy-6-hydroxymethyldihydropteridine diphosphokinase
MDGRIDGSMVSAYISLGSNMGDREKNLNAAIRKLRETAGIEVTAVSSYINTAPVGYENQPDFLNAALELKTTLTPEALLAVCNQIEKDLKRERDIRWGPRTIDLDILLYGDMIVEKDNLTIPHPRMHERVFVLKPLNEIAPQAVHPVLHKKVESLYNDLNNLLKH